MDPILHRFLEQDANPDDYGVDRCDNGDIRIKLGNVMPFEIPAGEAVKLAAILLKKAGCKVTIKDKVITAICRGISVNLN